MIKSKSYPKELDKKDLLQEINQHKVTIQAFKEKDQQRTERLASLGSDSSNDLPETNWKANCTHICRKIVDYLLERELEIRRQDEIIKTRSYAGFYYFIKWFVRALFFLIFTTIGAVIGKEIGCAIKDHDTCSTPVIELVNSSPHLAASLIGLVFGLLIGQWIGRYIWDKLTLFVRRCLRHIEKKDDKKKRYLYIFSFLIYLSVTATFSLIFFFTVNLNHNSEEFIGGIIGGTVGIILALFAYRKSATCFSVQEPLPNSPNLPPNGYIEYNTPPHTGNSSVTIPPDLII